MISRVHEIMYNYVNYISYIVSKKFICIYIYIFVVTDFL